MASVWDKFSDPVSAPPVDEPSWDDFSDPVQQRPSGGWREVRGAGGNVAPIDRNKPVPDYAAMFAPKSRLAEAGGVLDAGATMVANTIPQITGSAAAVIAPFVGGDSVAAEQRFGVQGWGAQPMTAAGRYAQQVIANNASSLFAPLTRAVKKVDDVTGMPFGEALRHTLTLAPVVSAARTLAPGVASVGSDIRQLARSVATKSPLTAEQTLARQQGAAGSQGAAAAVPDLTSASPELRKAVVKAGRKGGVDTEALRRQQQAESVGVRLTEGQAKQDPIKISEEQNLRGRSEKLVGRFNEQNSQLIDKLQQVREEVGPEVFTTNAVEHADEIIRSYRRLDSGLIADIKAKYKALADANGGMLPIDGGSFLRQASDSLRRENKAAYLPTEIKRTLANIQKSAKVEISQDGLMNQSTVTRTGGMTFGQFENLRTDLAAATRKAERAGDGNAKAAIALVRDALENMELPAGAENLKPLADAARTSARNRFQMIEADPAYKAAINKTVRPDLYVRRFVIGGDRDKVALMRQNLANDPVAGQTIAVAALDHLRNGARISPEWTGNFTHAGFAKTLQQLDPKAKVLFTPEQVETITNLRDVAGYTQFQPRGSFVNNSNTMVAGVAKYGGDAVAGAANVAAGGIPVGTWARNALDKATTGRRVNQMLAPGAGVRK